MANEEHLKILKQGVEAWNVWREENPEIICPDLEEADLSAADLTGANLIDAKEHLEILRRGAQERNAQEWRDWRDKQVWNVGHPQIKPDLTYANLTNAGLTGVGLTRADLTYANLDGADLIGADLIGAKLLNASLLDALLIDADLAGAYLADAYIGGADFTRANFAGATFTCAHIANAKLTGANLTSASITSAFIIGSNLTGAHLTGADLGWTAIVDVDLSVTEGLETVEHVGPSGIATSTLERTAAGLAKDASRQRAIEAFYRGCGLSDWEIEAAKLHNPNLTREQITDILYEIDRIRTDSPILVKPLFISYSHANTLFVEALEKQFDKKRIRYWRDVHDMKAGKMERQIERAIRHNPTVLLVLSEASVDSDWVEWEVSKARELEKQQKRDVLCPVALDDAWKTCSWPGPLRRQVEDYNILDFSEWQDDAARERQFQKLIEGLGMFYPTAG